LQIPAGMGADDTYNFDLATFATNFKIDIITTTYCVKALEQLGLITVTDGFYAASTLQVVVGRKDLEAFEQTHSNYTLLIKGILRNYGGAFDYGVSFKEKDLAFSVKTDELQLKQQLLALNNLGIIQYQPKTDLPKLTMLFNRMYKDSLYFDLDFYNQRKTLHINRIEQICNYIVDTKTCRSQFIAIYFAAPIEQVCKICDNCLNSVQVTVSTKDFEVIKAAIFELIGKTTVTPTQLCENLKQFKKHQIEEVLNYLITEQGLLVTKQGFVELRKV
jgi:ATP-dependent DNA helicase RecQ